MKHLLTFIVFLIGALGAGAQVGPDLSVTKKDLGGKTMEMVYSTATTNYYAVDLSDLDDVAREYFKESVYKASLVFAATVENKEGIWVLGSHVSYARPEVEQQVSTMRSAAMSRANIASDTEKKEVVNNKKK
ncbi:MAG: hypothetical protein IBJ09_00805 [Bacteroidia bacterium]|nr:hypothetical protein [Bacteroidia bacterium]